MLPRRVAWELRQRWEWPVTMTAKSRPTSPGRPSRGQASNGRIVLGDPRWRTHGGQQLREVGPEGGRIGARELPLVVGHAVAVARRIGPARLDALGTLVHGAENRACRHRLAHGDEWVDV